MEQKKITEENVQRKLAGKYLLKLIRAALHGEKVKEEPDCSWEYLYSLAEWNSVEGICGFGLNESTVPPDIFSKWMTKANNTLFRQVSFDAEREKILKKMAERGLSYLPLKGILIAGYYPQPGMRSMSDNDILYGRVERGEQGGYCLKDTAGKGEEAVQRSLREAQKIMVEIMKELGYEVESLKGNHDCYIKEPCFNFEMHRYLMTEESPYYYYYKEVWKRAIQSQSDPFCYYLSDEDEYIYFIIHAYKHYDGSGCGIRCVADEYVILNKKESSMNWEYIESELKALGVDQFEKELKAFAEHAFTLKAELTQEDEQMLLFMLGCGTYGTLSNQIEHTLDKIKDKSQMKGKNIKMSYWKERFFISEEKCKTWYPFFYRHRSLIWLLPAYRVVRGIVIHPGKLWSEWKNVWKYKK